jgi:hypothetical protein
MRLGIKTVVDRVGRVGQVGPPDTIGQEVITASAAVSCRYETRWGQERYTVMNPMATARGLQLAPNDKGAASGCRTAARQKRSPAACAASVAWMRNRGSIPSVDIGHFPLATHPASNPPNVQLARYPCCENRSLRRGPECLEHAGSIAPQKGGGADPMPKGRGLRAGER